MKVLQALRHKFLGTITLMIVTLQILNISIDPVDPHAGREDLSVNDIESCVELILEDLMGNFNAIDETEDHDEHSSKPVRHVTFFSATDSCVIVQLDFQLIPTANFSGYAEMGLYSYVRPILAPPPKLTI
ncbi:MAG TPA: hypothetical protein VGD65_10910 [Chryseosolibacter sp.]